MRRPTSCTRRRATIALVLLAALLAAGGATHLAFAQQDPGALRQHIDQQKAREQQLASAAARLGRLERAASHAVDVLSGRLAQAQSDLRAWGALLGRGGGRESESRQ